MAASVEALLKCPGCQQRYSAPNRHPKRLPCNDTACQECLPEQASNKLQCPICHSEHTVPDEGFHNNLELIALMDLTICTGCEKTAFLAQCSHCQTRLCEDCRIVHKERAGEGVCPVCRKKLALSKCTHCEKNICGGCRIDHLEEEAWEEIKKLRMPGKDWAEELRNNLTSLKLSIGKCMDEHIREIKEKKQELLNQLDEHLLNIPANDLTDVQNFLQRAQAQLQSPLGETDLIAITNDCKRFQDVSLRFRQQRVSVALLHDCGELSGMIGSMTTVPVEFEGIAQEIEWEEPIYENVYSRGGTGRITMWQGEQFVRLAVCPVTGEIYIGQMLNSTSCCYVHSPNDRMLMRRQFIVPGRLLDLTVNHNRLVVAVVGANDRTPQGIVFDHRGTEIRRLPEFATDAFSSITLATRGDLVYVACSSGLHVCHIDDTSMYTVGQAVLTRPTAVAVGVDGQAIVADSGKLTVFNESGAVRSIDGDWLGRLGRICVDVRGFVLISNYIDEQERIEVLTHQLEQYCTIADVERPFGCITGLAVTPGGGVLVAQRDPQDATHYVYRIDLLLRVFSDYQSDKEDSTLSQS